MLAHARFQYIVDLVNRKGFINNKELSLKLNVSEATIRRDCEELERQGLLIRIHGGAKRLSEPAILRPEDEIAMNQRHSIHLFEKQKVAKAAASYVQDGDCIFLDGGTSISVLIPFLEEKKVTIVTHSQLVVNECADHHFDLITLGGKFDARYAMSVGPIALENLSRFNFDLCFIGCAGIDFEEEILYTAELDTLALKELAIKQSNRRYLLVDSSKIEVKGFCKLHGFDGFDAILCNDDEKLNSLSLAPNIQRI